MVPMNPASTVSDPHAQGPSVDPDQVAFFSRIAAQWWDPHGKFAPLHRFNPVRLGFIRDRALACFGRDGRARASRRARQLPPRARGRGGA